MRTQHRLPAARKLRRRKKAPLCIKISHERLTGRAGDVPGDTVERLIVATKAIGSTRIDEQNFTASVVTALQAAQEWSSTAVVVTYDDSDGWYDHQAPSIVNPSSSVADFLNGSGLCNSGAQQSGAAPTTPLLGAPPVDGGTALPAQGRCGYGTRIPLLVISPYAKANYIDHTLVDQTSVLKFVEDNWLGGQRVQPGGSFDMIANSIQNMLSGI